MPGIFMKKTVIVFINGLRRLYWFLVRPTTIGVRALMIIDDVNIVLVKHYYTKKWYLPGGKVERCESPYNAILRELREEVGIVTPLSVVLHGVYFNQYEHKSYYIVVYAVSGFQLNPKVNFEIERVQCFDINKLPLSISGGSRRRIEEWKNRNPPSADW